MKGREYIVEMASGTKFKISELDFNNILGRISKGQVNGWYRQRGETMKDSRDEWQLSFKDVAMVYAKGITDKTIRKPESIDVDKHKPEPVGKPEVKKDTKCPHDWNIPSNWIHVTKIVGGVNRYYKQCVNCGANSQLIKKREVELAQGAIGETLDTVPLVK